MPKERFAKSLWADRISDSKSRLLTVHDEADRLRCIVEGIRKTRDGGHKRKNAYETRSSIYFESGQLFAAKLFRPATSGSFKLTLRIWDVPAY